jgi:transposase
MTIAAEQVRAATRGGSVALTQIRHSALGLLEQGRSEEALALVVAALEAVLRRSSELELQLAKLQRERLGRRSERIDPAQLRLLFESLQGAVDPGPQTPEEDEELTRRIEDAEAKARAEKDATRKARRRDGGIRVRNVERVVHHHQVPGAELRCGLCGVDKQVMGHEVTFVLEYKPGHFIEHEHRREKAACPKCREGVVTAPAPAKPIERSVASPSLLAHVVVAKAVDHMPLHRLHKVYERGGVSIPVSTLADWHAAAADQLEPLVQRLERRVVSAHVVHTDATGIKVLDPRSSHNIERGTVWCYASERDVVFRYAPTGEGSTGPWEFLVGRKGYIQADAASVFDRLYNGAVASAMEVGCWAHARRKLFALQDTDPRVAYPLKLIATLYRIEHLADAQKLDPDQRRELRQERTSSVLEKLKRWLVDTSDGEPPGAALAKAAAYTVNHWTALTRFLDDGRLALDNNHCEAQIRAVAMGRRNYLFCGSHQGARRMAVLYSITRTCALHGVAPLPYLTDVLAKLAEGWPQSRIDELLPDRWQPSAAK